MSSEKQIHANQQNAQFSTGPVTSEGKMIVASNAIKHGIFTGDFLKLKGVSIYEFKNGKIKRIIDFS